MLRLALRSSYALESVCLYRRTECKRLGTLFLFSKSQSAAPHPLRTFSTSFRRRADDSNDGTKISRQIIYTGPLSRTFRNLKLFSLSSFGIATALTPFMFIVDTQLPFMARVSLASIAMLTSGLSTGLVAWCGHPYVTSIRALAVGTAGGSATDQPGSSSASEPQSHIEGIQMETMTLALRQRFTTVYDPSFLVETRRPLATWELAERVAVGAEVQRGADEETIAETSDPNGNIIGRWVVKWSKDGREGTCNATGKVQRSVLF